MDNLNQLLWISIIQIIDYYYSCLEIVYISNYSIIYL